MSLDRDKLNLALCASYTITSFHFVTLNKSDIQWACVPQFQHTLIFIQRIEICVSQANVCCCTNKNLTFFICNSQIFLTQSSIMWRQECIENIYIYNKYIPTFSRYAPKPKFIGHRQVSNMVQEHIIGSKWWYVYVKMWYIISGNSRVVTDYTLLLLTYIDCDNVFKQHHYIQ